MLEDGKNFVGWDYMETLVIHNDPQTGMWKYVRSI